jgi:hypothetical protein
MFAGKTEPTGVKQLLGAPSRVGSWPNPQTLRWAGEAFQGQTL